MGRGSVVQDEVGGLLQAAGAGDVAAFAGFYERTASVVFHLLEYALREPAAAERATVRVYAHVWRTAPAFEPATMSGCAFLMLAVRRELDGRQLRGDPRRARADHGCRPAGRRGVPGLHG